MPNVIDIKEKIVGFTTQLTKSSFKFVTLITLIELNVKLKTVVMNIVIINPFTPFNGNITYIRIILNTDSNIWSKLRCLTN